jgi:hypothetical protein
MRNELVPVGPADELVKVQQQVEAFFVRDRAKRVVWVSALETGDELGELVFFAKQIDRVHWPAVSCHDQVWFALD